MKALKKVCLLLLFVIANTIVFAQDLKQKTADIVILIDTSGTILKFYEAINKRVLTEITNKFIRKGDTVHVLSFNSDARYEMSQKINSEGDLSRVISRFFLLYQLGKNSDFLTGLDYCKTYTANLSANTSNKEQILIVISDGIFNPPANSPYKNYTNDQIKNELGLRSSEIRQQGWKVYYVKLPFPADAVIRDLDGGEFFTGKENSSNKDRAANKNANTTSNNIDKNSNSNSNNGSTDISNNQNTADSNISKKNKSQNDLGNKNSADSESTKKNGIPNDANTNNSSNVGQNITPNNKGSADSNENNLPNNTENTNKKNGNLTNSGDNSSSGNDVDHSDNSIGKNGDSNSSIVNSTDNSNQNNDADDNVANGSGNSSSDKNGDNSKKEYIDVSKNFTDSAGASKSELSDNVEFKIEDNSKILPSVIFPDELKSYGSKLSFDLIIENNSDKDVDLKLNELVLDNESNVSHIHVSVEKIIIAPNESKTVNVTASLPQFYSSGDYNTKLRLEFEEGKHVLPQVAELKLVVLPTLMQKVFSINPIYIIVIALILLLLLLLIFLLLHRRNSNSVSAALQKASNLSPVENSTPSGNSTSNTSIYSDSNRDKVLAQNQSDRHLQKKILESIQEKQEQRGTHLAPANHLEKIEIKRNQSGMTEIYVLNQNRNIGKRNIHVMKPGTRLSVGGGKGDDFLIFLVSFPSRLAQVRYDGQDYHLAILKPEFFPYETSNVVSDCIGKTVTVVSDKGYHVYFTFRGYEDPAVKLNNILTSINYG